MIAIEVPPSKRQLTSSLIGIFASKVTKVNRAALANAQRHASVQRFGELTGLLVNACQVSESLHWPLSRYTPATPRQGLSLEDPPRNGVTITFIFLAECGSQSWLLIGHDKQMKAPSDNGAIPEHADVSQKQSLTDDHGYHRHIHGISYEPIEPGDHQVPRRKYRRGRAQPLQRESRKGVHKHRDSGGDQQTSHDAERQPSNSGAFKTPSGNPPWSQSGDEPRRQQEKQCGSDHGEHPPHPDSSPRRPAKYKRINSTRSSLIG